MTEKEKMLNSKIYDPSDKELAKLRTMAHRLSKDYNDTYDDEIEKRTKILNQLFPHRGENSYLQGPIYFDYGVFTTVGKNFYANFNFTILDCSYITIGDNVYFGPNCTLATAVHPMRGEDRRFYTKEDGTVTDYEYAKPITIGNDCWIASNVVICAGVTIGNDCVIGAGSVVTKDIPSHSFAAGNPCRVIRKITDKDRLENMPNWKSE